jgi:hypothetical protein
VVIVWFLNGGRPPTAPPAAVQVSLEGVDLGTVTPGDELRAYRFDLPAALAARAAVQPDPLRLRLEVPVWNPREVLGTPDSRDLGVMVTRVQVQ